MKKLTTILCAFSFAALPIFAEGEAPKAEATPAPEAQKPTSKLPEFFKKRILNQFDKDKDGFLDDAELAAAKASLVERRNRFEEMQKRHAKRVLKEFDKDNDGKLSAEELVPLIEKQRRMFADISNRRGEPPAPRPHMRGERPQMRAEANAPLPPDVEAKPKPEQKPDEIAPRQGRRGDRQMRQDRPRFPYPQPEDLNELKK